MCVPPDMAIFLWHEIHNLPCALSCGCHSCCRHAHDRICKATQTFHFLRRRFLPACSNRLSGACIADQNLRHVQRRKEHGHHDGQPAQSSCKCFQGQWIAPKANQFYISGVSVNDSGLDVSHRRVRSSHILSPCSVYHIHRISVAYAALTGQQRILLHTTHLQDQTHFLFCCTQHTRKSQIHGKRVA